MMIVIMAGVSGSGKTTVGTLLADRLGWQFADADTFHPPESIEKMRAGIPLADSDRWPWLRAIAAWMIFLAADRQLLARRLAARHGHFFPRQLLGTQLDGLEPPQPGERVLSLVPAQDPAATVDAILALPCPEEAHEAEA